ncbi:hypothetical protein ACTFQF_00405 [Aliivibrio fischeri]|uniref:hypothetical protein n=1 Tax=Aliivibrio fischeri TaxID=668 RepID=UPI0007C5005C|nr:hypothetical protein [Aliivibrio fischeri]
MNGFKNLIEWAKLSNVTFPDINDNPDQPDFFIVEEFLASLAMILVLSSVVAALTPLLAYIEIIELHSSHYWNIFYFILSALGIGLGLISTVHTLVKRPITPEHFEWMITVYRKIEMPHPNPKMVKQDMAIYIEKSIQMSKC